MEKNTNVIGIHYHCHWNIYEHNDDKQKIVDNSLWGTIPQIKIYLPSIYFA